MVYKNGEKLNIKTIIGIRLCKNAGNFKNIDPGNVTDHGSNDLLDSFYTTSGDFEQNS